MPTMEINLKYNLGDIIYFMQGNKICCSKIIEYEIVNTGILSYNKSQYPDEFNRTIKYKTSFGIKVDEKDAFATEDDIINSLRATMQKSIYPVK